MEYVYVKVQWHHEFPDDPIVYYCELGPDRYETRKVQVYRDGRSERADAQHETGDIFLSDLAVPPLEEIAADPEFTPEEIDAQQFEQIWQQAVA
jgi:hypothetical protein